MHIPVLLGEAVEKLNLKKGDAVVDATLGGGGHSREIMNKIGKNGILVAFDLDSEAVSEFEKSLKKQKKEPEVFLKIENFAKIDEVLESENLSKVDAILADLGWRSDQMENENYGMSFQKDSPLDMRLAPNHTVLGKAQNHADRGKVQNHAVRGNAQNHAVRGNAQNHAVLGKTGGLTAGEIVNTWKAEDLKRLFKEYGEEKFAGRAAKAIEKQRKIKEIETTKELSEVIKKAIGGHYKTAKIHPATRVFQALRIAVNNELENLREFLEASLRILKPGGRIAIISFHSLEDRTVKKFFRVNAGGCICPKEFPVCVCGKKPKIKIITKKPITPTDEEIRRNPRSRSAKMRVAEKL